MAALYRCWDGRRPVDLVALAADLLGDGGRVDQACRHVADVVARWGGHPYHSAQHHAEVATNAAVLADIMHRMGRPLPPARRAVMLAAALSHDLNYEPGPPRARFTAEREAAEAMDAIAGRFGLAQADRDDIRVLILATEPGFRPRLARLRRAPGASAELPAFLEPLATRPELAELAAILSDADLLSSSGLTLRWRRVQRGRLERELGHRIPPADDLAFFDRIVADGYLSLGGQHFTPNLLRIRQAVRDEVAKGSA
jgi:hypothetical protein